VVAVIVPVATVAMVEHVHQGARQQQQIRECPQQMGTMFCPQKECCNREKPNQYPLSATGVCASILVFHINLLVHSNADSCITTTPSCYSSNTSMSIVEAGMTKPNDLSQISPDVGEQAHEQRCITAMTRYL
jgi:hypothetical protein